MQPPAAGRHVRERVCVLEKNIVSSFLPWHAYALTTKQFAARFGFSVATLRHWERGDRSPQGAALVLLNPIDRNLVAVLVAL